MLNTTIDTIMNDLKIIAFGFTNTIVLFTKCEKGWDVNAHKRINSAHRIDFWFNSTDQPTVEDAEYYKIISERIL